MKRFVKTAIALCAALGSVQSAQAQSVTLQADRDNTLYESATGAVSNGIGASGFTGGTAQGAIRRFLIRFDVAGSVPAGATITSATLEISCTLVPSGAQPDSFGTHRVLADWGEGTSSGTGQGVPSTPGDATWIHTFFPGSNWVSAGGDFDPAASSSVNMNSAGRFSWTSAGLAAEVQSFLDTPGNNFGWMVKAASEGIKTARVVGSREGSLVFRPTLNIDYTTGSSTGTVTTFCNNAFNNSTGSPAVLTGAFGSGFGTGLHLDVSGGPVPLAGGSRMLGYFLVGDTAQVGVPVSDGLFCLIGAGGSFGRYNVAGTTRFSLGLFDAAGNLENLVGTGGASGYGFDVPSEVEIAGTAPATIMAGDTYHFQAWHRDTLAGIGHSNFSTAVSVTF